MTKLLPFFSPPPLSPPPFSRLPSLLDRAPPLSLLLIPTKNRNRTNKKTMVVRSETLAGDPAWEDPRLVDRAEDEDEDEDGGDEVRFWGAREGF